MKFLAFVTVGALQAAEKRNFTLSVEVVAGRKRLCQRSRNASTGTSSLRIPQPALLSVLRRRLDICVAAYGSGASLNRLQELGGVRCGADC